MSRRGRRCLLGVVCPFVVDGEDALMDYTEDDWDCDAKEFEGESDSYEERHFVGLSRLCTLCMGVPFSRPFSPSLNHFTTVLAEDRRYSK